MQVLVQVGDVLDRGEDEIAILSLLAYLGKQARSTGGAVFQVLFSCFLCKVLLSCCRGQVNPGLQHCIYFRVHFVY